MTQKAVWLPLPKWEEGLWQKCLILMIKLYNSDA